MREAIDALLNGAVADAAMPGVVAAVFDAEQTLYHGAYGRASTAADAPMTEDSVMAIMSMTKALTAAASLQLLERGLLTLDAPASEVCPELGNTLVLEGFSGSGEPILRAPATPITLRHLLTHTSGFVYNTWNETMLRYMAHTDTPDISTLKKAALQVPIVFDPGSRWEYGIGIDWVGQMVEAASGTTLGAYFAQHLTGPLGMTDTAFAPTPQMAARRVPIHMRQADGTLSPLPDRPPKAPEFEMGGGGLLSTAADYGRFIRMLLGNGTLDRAKVLEPSSVAALLTNQIGDLRVTPLPSALPQLSNDAEFFPGSPKSWSLGFQISETACDTGRAAGTAMWAGLANSYCWIDPENQLGGVFMTQIFPFVDHAVMPIYYQFEAAAYASRQKESL